MDVEWVNTLENTHILKKSESTQNKFLHYYKCMNNDNWWSLLMFIKNLRINQSIHYIKFSQKVKHLEQIDIFKEEVKVLIINSLFL